jgi:hypothetical protein
MEKLANKEAFQDRAIIRALEPYNKGQAQSGVPTAPGITVQPR